MLFQILIENSQNIGILPCHIAQSISNETSSSMDNGLDSFELLGKSKKKKHRSGSLTRKPHLSASTLNMKNIHQSIFVYFKHIHIYGICVYEKDL